MSLILIWCLCILLLSALRFMDNSDSEFLGGYLFIVVIGTLLLTVRYFILNDRFKVERVYNVVDTVIQGTNHVLYELKNGEQIVLKKGEIFKDSIIFNITEYDRLEPEKSTSKDMKYLKFKPDSIYSLDELDE